jgi:hypothetical protein
MSKVPKVAWVVALLLIINPVFADSGKKQALLTPAESLPFQSGETLTYEISWSDLIDAGTAVMQLTEKKNAEGALVYQIVSTARTSRWLSKFYKVSDSIVSVMDADRIRSLSYRLDQHHGRREKKRTMTFDYAKGIVTVLADGQKNVYPVPDDIQDPLSSIYYLRTKHDFVAGKTIPIPVHDDGKNWTVDVQILGREQVSTPLGRFNTIKLKTYPKYEGVFQNTGEIYIWITDDHRKIPVLMKSVISIGSIVSTLIKYQAGEARQ